MGKLRKSIKILLIIFIITEIFMILYVTINDIPDYAIETSLEHYQVIERVSLVRQIMKWEAICMSIIIIVLWLLLSVKKRRRDIDG